MLSVRSRVRLISISSRSACGRPLPRPPLVATMQLPGMGESASPIVSSLCPPVYVCAVSIICTPAATAALISSTPPRVFASRFVPSPMRATSVSPNLMECSFMMLARVPYLCVGLSASETAARRAIFAPSTSISKTCSMTTTQPWMKYRHPSSTWRCLPSCWRSA